MAPFYSYPDSTSNAATRADADCAASPPSCSARAAARAAALAALAARAARAAARSFGHSQPLVAKRFSKVRHGIHMMPLQKCRKGQGKANQP